MHNMNISGLQKLKEIIHKFIKRSDEYNQLIHDGQYPALCSDEAEIDLIKLEQITREFINDSGNISEEEVLKHKECVIMLPGEKQLVENLKKLEKRLSDFIGSVHDYKNLERDGHCPAFFNYPRKEDFMVLAKITNELFSEKDDFEFVDKKDVPDKEELPDTSLAVQNTSKVRMLSWLGFSS